MTDGDRAVINLKLDGIDAEPVAAIDDLRGKGIPK